MINSNSVETHRVFETEPMMDRETMSQAHLDMSVIICAYTEARWDNLVAAVESVRSQSTLPREIIVVVDHNALLLERVRGYLPDVISIENRGTRGLSAARNSGVAAARGGVIVFLDDDAVAAPDWLEQLAVVYQQPQVWGVGGAIEPLWLDQRPSWFPDEFNWVIGCTYRGLPQASAPVRNLIGANMSFRREVFRTVGGFRSGMGRVGTHPLGCEETELCIRARQFRPSQTLLYEPRAKVRHCVPAARSRWRYFCSRCYAEGLSKALVARLVGAKDGLAAERSYTFYILPGGVIRGLAAGVLRGDMSGLTRAGAIVAGLLITTTGYVLGLARTRLAWWPAQQPGQLTWEDST